MRRNSRPATCSEIFAVSASHGEQGVLVVLLSRHGVEIETISDRLIDVTKAEYDRFKRLAFSADFLAFLGSSQRLGSSERRSTSARRRALASKSKIPPKVGGSGFEVLERVPNLIQAFWFHSPLVYCVGPMPETKS